MGNKEKRPAEMETPSGTVQITLPDYNMFSPEEQEKAAEIMELIWMALQANSLEERKAEKTGCLPTVSFYFSGSVANFSVECYRLGYDKQAKAERMDAYTDVSFKSSFPVKYGCMKKYLHSILEEMNHDRV